MWKLLKDFLRKIMPESMFNFLQPYYARLKMRKRLITAYFRSKQHLPPVRKYDKIIIGFHVVEHCNLNCASCDNFSAIAEKEFIDPERFRKDMEHLGRMFHHECERISLLGGEPLLHPELVKFIETARENFSSGYIEIITNGILLTQQHQEFWQACRDNQVTISVTHYPISIDIAKIRELAEKYDVELKLSDMTKSTFYKRAVDITGSGDTWKNFVQCIRNDCITLGHDGHLFPCTFASNIHHFNKKFGFNIPITEDDYIDIYKEDDPQKILRRLSEPIPMCRFCDLNYKPFRWHQSKQELSEWV